MIKDTLEVYRLILALHHHRIEAIAAVFELNNLVGAVPDGVVVMHDEILEAFDKPSLHVTGFGGLDGSIDETFATAL